MAVRARKAGHPVGLEESLYYCVREAACCYCGMDPNYREPDERILPALEFFAASERPPDSPYVCQVSIDAFCDAMVRRGRLDDLKRIKWLHVIPPGEGA